MRTLLSILLGASFLSGCASSVVGVVDPLDGAAPDVGPGLNPDGQDPFRPTDAGVITVDGAVEDTGVWQLPDGSAVFDQRYGYVYVGSVRSGDTWASYASAEFRLVPRPEDPRCSYVSASSWDFITCLQMGEASRDPHPSPFPTAGTLTFTGGTQSVSLAAQSTGSYNTFYNQDPVFLGPRSVRVSARGSSGVPPFAVDVAIPPPLVVTRPDPGAGTATIDRTQDLVLEWTPNPARSVVFTLSATAGTGADARSVTISADFYGNVGRAVIPARVMSRLPAVTAGMTVTYAFTPRNLTVQQVGPWPVQLTGAGRGVTGRATLR